jgi:signal transduction histidine kinase
LLLKASIINIIHLIVGGMVLGLAIASMHYTGMAASVFTPYCGVVTNSAKSLDPTILAIAVAAITFIILGIAFFTSTHQEAINQQEFDKARELGMAEISASVLHSVGNVLNSVNTSVAIISEKIASSQLVGLEKISTLLNEHKDDLGTFITKDTRGIYTLDFINKLAEYWREEKRWFSTELLHVTKNLALINDIIITQQDLSKKTTADQIVSVRELIKEALLIVGLKQITVETHFWKIGEIVTDRVKLLQIIVNLLHNANEALKESVHFDKRLRIKTKVINKKTIAIEIADNGVGIPPENLNKIFNFGFTTKITGHGFGLHNSAFAINELGGAIHVKSDGLNQGAKFILELPYKRPKA